MMPTEATRSKKSDEALSKLKPVQSPADHASGNLTEPERRAKAKEVSALAREAVQKQAKTARKAAVPGEMPQEAPVAPPWSVDPRDQLQAFMESQTVVLDSTATIGWEAFEFTNRRLRHDFETLARLSKCESPRELYEVQSNFAEVAMGNYLSESSKILDFMATSCSAWWRPWEKSMTRAE